VFAQKLRLNLVAAGGSSPVSKDWLDQFFMRDFTGASAFDEILVTGDGELEAGFGVDPAQVKAQFEKWLRGRKMIDAGTALTIS
jgi:hypothetical protein